MGKTVDLDGPALPALGKKTNGCVDHRLDKLFGVLAQHPECLELMAKLRSRNNAPQEFANGSFQKCCFQPRATLVPDQIHGRHTLVEFVFFPRQFLHESRDFETHARQWTFSRSC